MRRKQSAPSLKSDSGPEELDLDGSEDRESSIYVADATSSGTLSDLEKDPASDIPEEDEDEEDEGHEEVSEGTSLLPPFYAKARASSSFYGSCTIKDDFGEDEDGEDGELGLSQSFPDVIYASPVRPHLPSPSASNPHAQSISPRPQKQSHKPLWFSPVPAMPA